MDYVAEKEAEEVGAGPHVGFDVGVHEVGVLVQVDYFTAMIKSKIKY